MNRPSAWGSDWFLGLSVELRLAWQFIVAHADRGGFFDAEPHQHLLRLACTLSTRQIIEGLRGQLVALTPQLWQIKGWVPDQYPRDYKAKLSGVHVAVLKELRRRSSQFGPAIVKTAFNGFPAWPELGEPETSPAEGGDIPVEDGGGPPVSPGSTGMARPGQARPGSLPPQSKAETSRPGYAKSKGAPVMQDVTADDLEIHALSGRWLAVGFMNPDWPPFTRRAVLEAARAFGMDAVSFAAKRFLDAGGDNLTPKRFGNELGDWLRTVPVAKRQCLQGHTLEGALLPRTDYPNGPVMRAKKCSWCGFTEPAQGSVEASTETPPCDHAHTERLAGPLAARAGMEGKVVCQDCGQTVEEVAA